MMTVKREAAFHEAGHAIAAWKSKYHSLVGNINLADYGAGDALVSVSRRKLQNGGKAVTATIAMDPDVAKDLAVVLSAGLVAEQVAESKGENITANPQCAVPDHELLKQQLAAAGLSVEFDRHEIAARQLLLSEWPLLLNLANLLYQKGSLEAIDVAQFINDFPSIEK